MLWPKLLLGVYFDVCAVLLPPTTALHFDGRPPLLCMHGINFLTQHTNLPKAAIIRGSTLGLAQYSLALTVFTFSGSFLVNYSCLLDFFKDWFSLYLSFNSAHHE